MSQLPDNLVADPAMPSQHEPPKGQDHRPSFIDNVTSNLPESCLALLDTLYEVAQILNIDDVSFASYSTAILELSTRRLCEKRTLLHLERAERELNDHLAVIRHEERLITKWVTELQAEPSTTNIIALEKRRDASIKKAKEYRQALDELMGNAVEEPSISVADVVNQKEKNAVKERALKAKRAKLQAFQGLPPNLELARHELKSSQEEYHRLLQLRERLLGRMADGLH